MLPTLHANRLRIRLNMSDLLGGLLGIWMIAALWWHLFPWGNADHWDLMSGIWYLPLMVAAGGFSLRAALQTGIDQRLGRAWRLVAVAALLYGAGDLIWFYQESYLGISPFPSVADAFFLLCYPVLFWALTRFPAAGASREGQIQIWLDALVTGLSTWIITWYFILGPLLRADGSGSWESLLTLMYPIGDLIVATVVIVQLNRWRLSRSTMPLVTLGFGILFWAAADLIFAYVELQGTYDSSGPQDLFWLIGDYFWVVAAYLQYRLAPGGGAPEPEVPARPALSAYPSVIICYLILIWTSRQQGGTAPQELLYGVGGLLVVIMVRQAVISRENNRLSALSAARQTEKRFRSLIQNSSDVVTILGKDGRIIFQSPSMKKVFGYSHLEMQGTPLASLLHADEVSTVMGTLREVRGEPGGEAVAEWRIRHRDGSWRHTEMTIKNMLTDPSVQGMVINTRDITERKVLERRLHYQAYYDSLTGLANRVLFKERVEKALLSHLHGPPHVSVLFIDLDGFKLINDSYGHAFGDQVLILVAARVLSNATRADTVARFSGNGFAVLLGAVDRSETQAVAEHIIEGLRTPLMLRGSEVIVKASIGIADTQHGQLDSDELLHNADAAMDAAKALGRGACAWFDPSMHSIALERLQTETALRRSTEQGEFVLHFQPIFDLRSGAIEGLEALIRWRHPERGLLAPGLFIPLAEDTGLIVAVGRWALREACRQAQAWSGANLSWVSVNLSIRQLLDPSVVADVSEALLESGLPANRLVLELTETVLMQGSQGGINTMRALCALGVRFSIDDFGTGYSSLSYLRRLPVNFIKLDKSFITDLATDEKARALVCSVVDLSAALGLYTVAEGIETLEQAEMLGAMGCRSGQGFHFSRPLPAVQVDTMLAGARRSVAPEASSTGTVV